MWNLPVNQRFSYETKFTQYVDMHNKANNVDNFIAYNSDNSNNAFTIVS